jgi:hypothetical protein
MLLSLDGPKRRVLVKVGIDRYDILWRKHSRWQTGLVCDWTNVATRWLRRTHFAGSSRQSMEERELNLWDLPGILGRVAPLTVRPSCQNDACGLCWIVSRHPLSYGQDSTASLLNSVARAPRRWFATRCQMSKKSKIAMRNQNWTGWWIFQAVQQWVSKAQKKRKLSSKSRCRVWENTVLIRAKDRNEAYRKAMKIGRLRYGGKHDKGESHFIGISFLSPVYEDVEDGAEVLWSDRGLMTVKAIKNLVPPTNQLVVFDDTEE